MARLRSAAYLSTVMWELKNHQPMINHWMDQTSKCQKRMEAFLFTTTSTSFSFNDGEEIYPYCLWIFIAIDQSESCEPIGKCLYCYTGVDTWLSINIKHRFLGWFSHFSYYSRHQCVPHHSGKAMTTRCIVEKESPVNTIWWLGQYGVCWIISFKWQISCFVLYIIED